MTLPILIAANTNEPIQIVINITPEWTVEISIPDIYVYYSEFQQAVYNFTIPNYLTFNFSSSDSLFHEYALLS